MSIKKIFLTFSPQYPCFYDIMSKFADERKHIKTQRHVADISYHLILYIFATCLFTKQSFRIMRLFTKQTMLFFLSVMLSVPFLSSCADDDNPVPYPSSCTLYVRLIDVAGNNILTHSGILDKDTTKADNITLSPDNDTISVSWIRKADNKPAIMLHNNRLKTVTDADWTTRPGAYLVMNYLDEDVTFGDKGYEHDETYVITLKSERLFGQAEQHKIELTVHIVGNRMTSITGCAVDGREKSIADIQDPNSADKLKGYITMTAE